MKNLTPEQADDLWGKTVSAIDNTLGSHGASDIGNWYKGGGWTEGNNPYWIRSRMIQVRRVLPAMFSLCVGPEHYVPEWPAGTHTLDEQEGSIEYEIGLIQSDKAPRNTWRLPKKIENFTRRYQVGMRVVGMTKPDLHARDLTPEENSQFEDQYRQYGGYKKFESQPRAPVGHSGYYLEQSKGRRTYGSASEDVFGTCRIAGITKGDLSKHCATFISVAHPIATILKIVDPDSSAYN